MYFTCYCYLSCSSPIKNLKKIKHFFFLFLFFFFFFIPNSTQFHPNHLFPIPPIFYSQFHPILQRLLISVKNESLPSHLLLNPYHRAIKPGHQGFPKLCTISGYKFTGTKQQCSFVFSMSYCGFGHFSR